MKSSSMDLSQYREHEILRAGCQISWSSVGVGVVPTRTPEQDAEMRTALAERITYARRMTMTPGVVAWLWDDEDKLREPAKGLSVAALREAQDESGSVGASAGGQAKGSEKKRPYKSPYKIAYENLRTSDTVVIRKIWRRGKKRVGAEPRAKHSLRWQPLRSSQKLPQLPSHTIQIGIDRRLGNSAISQLLSNL